MTSARRQAGPPGAWQHAARESGARALDRLLGGVLLLLLSAGAAFVFLAALGLLDTARAAPFGFDLGQLLGFDRDPQGFIRLGAGSAALLVGLTATVAFVRRLAGEPVARPAAAGMHVLRADERGIVRVDSAGICAVANAAALRTPGVVDARAEVLNPEGAQLRLGLGVWVSAAAEVGQTGEAVRQNVVEAVQRLVGLEVAQAVVNLKVVPLSQVGRMLQ